MVQGLWVPLPCTGTSVQPHGPPERHQPRVWVSNRGLLAPRCPPDTDRSVFGAGSRSACQGDYSWAWHGGGGLIHSSALNSRGAER